jgi:hypothetical protein
MYPQATVCPILFYAGGAPGLTMLTSKYDATTRDSCVGKADHNDCHDPSGFGGANLGLVSSLAMNSSMVMLQRAYNPEAKDTCVFHEGAMDTFCKATAGEYTGVTDLGYIFSKEVPGTLPLKAYWDSLEQDTCASTKEEDCPGVIEGTLGYVVDEVAVDAWNECGAQDSEDRKWVISMLAEMDAAPDVSSPKTEKVPWIAMKQGVFTTSNGKMIQAGVSRVPADTEFHPIKFFQAFPSEPVVFVGNVDPVDMVRIKGETAEEFTASADAGFENIHYEGSCAFKGWGITIPELGRGTHVSPSTGMATCKPHLSEQECLAAKGDYTLDEDGPEECHYHCAVPHIWPFEGCFIGWNNCHTPKVTNSYQDPHICVYNEKVIGRCRGNTPLDWGSCKTYVTSEDACVSHPECHWETNEAEHTAPLVEVNWIAIEKTDDGVLGAYPFIAGDTQVGDETTVTFDAGFTQVPLIYGSLSGDAKADLRVTGKDVGNMSLILQGAEADEKASYFVYNGQSAVGTAFKAEGSVITYAYEVAEFGECVASGDGVSGDRQRTVDCKRSDGESVDDFYCVGARPHETEACVIQTFFLLNTKNGRCVGPAGGSAGLMNILPREAAARDESCDSAKSKFKMESGQNGGFVLKNAGTGLCYCRISNDNFFADKADMHFANDCSSALCDLEKEDTAPDGTFQLAPLGYLENGRSIRTARRRAKGEKRTLKIGSTDAGDAARFAFVTEGALIIDSYVADKEAGARKKKQFKLFGHTLPGGGWYKDKTGEMLKDKARLDGDFATTKAGQTGVGWLDEVAIDFTLAESGPIQTVNVGFQFMKEWQVKKPKKMQVQCSSDGETFGNPRVFSGSDLKVRPDARYKDEDGGRKVMSFQVADICGDDTALFRVTVTPQAGSKDKKAVIDEVQAFAPFKFD